MADGEILSFWQIVRRETERQKKYLNFFLFALIGPVITCLFFASIFSNPIMTHIPVAVYDADRTSYSRELLRMLDSSSLVKPIYRVDSWEEGLSLIKQGKVNAVFGINKGFSADLLSGSGAVVVGRYDNQFMTQGSTVNRAFQEVVANYAAEYDAVKYMSKSIPPEDLAGYILPVNVQNNLLYNPSLNYAWFLLLGLLPVMWQLFATGTTVYMVGNEFKDGGADEIAATAQNNVLWLMSAKLFPYFIIFMMQMCVVLVILFGWADVPHRDMFFITFLATVLYVLATISTGFFIIAVFRQLAVSISATSVFVAPAFAYAGVTFPYEAMPPVAKIWSNILPITHYHRSLIELAMRGAGVQDVILTLSGLLPFLLLFPVALYLYRGRILSFAGGKK